MTGWDKVRGRGNGPDEAMADMTSFLYLRPPLELGNKNCSGPPSTSPHEDTRCVTLYHSHMVHLMWTDRQLHWYRRGHFGRADLSLRVCELYVAHGRWLKALFLTTVLVMLSLNPHRHYSTWGQRGLRGFSGYRYYDMIYIPLCNSMNDVACLCKTSTLDLRHLSHL